jgi:FMN phosphatase YigB (HAD superfamily)
MLKAVIFDFGHTIVNELKHRDLPLSRRPICLMPHLAEILPRIQLKMGIWANTRRTRQPGIRAWLERAGIGGYFKWIVTSVDAGARKPSPRFFSYALRTCNLSRSEILFVGNQLNTDIIGANRHGIRCVWLSGDSHRSPDDSPVDTAHPTYVIESLKGLPTLIESVVGQSPYVTTSSHSL